MEMHKSFGWIAALIAVALAGCATPPSTNIQTPMSARPQQVALAAENNGSIFQPKQGMALFEDRRARRVGDILTVYLVERTSATRGSETTEDRSASADMSIPVPTVLGKKLPLIGETTWGPDASSSQSFKDKDTNTNNISGAVTVTVIDVLDNGNLRVSGEKQVAVNNDTDYIRIAGVVNPTNITASNTVNSTQLADVQIESKNSQGIDYAQMTSMLARFFLTILPF
jgi:flagellar L-ring protein precursor FlgH